MQEKLFYLKSEIYLEPLCNGWYAWPYLMQPATYARNMVHTHKRLMTSFVKNYKLHQLAKNNPAMVGGNFVDCSAEQVAEIRSMITSIENDHKELISLSEGISELEVMLTNHDREKTVESLYAAIPDVLKGYVELFVDQDHNPSYRLIESLLYESKYYKPELQSVMFGSTDKVEKRPFVFSTPRLADDHHLHVNMSFNDESLKKLLKARTSPISQQEIDAIFEGKILKGGLKVEELFTTSEPKLSYKCPDYNVRVQYTGHAGFMVETGGITIMIDPVIAVRDQKINEDLIDYSELPPVIDYVLLTHAHQDHMNIETLLQIRDRVDKVIVPKNNGGSLFDPSMKLILQQLEFDVFEIEDMERVVLPDNKGIIRAIPFLGEHGDLNIRSKTAWFIEASGKKFYFGADSSNLEPEMYRHIQKITGNLDLLAIGMECVGAPYTWMYGGLVTQFVSQNVKDERRLNGSDFEKAKNMAEIFSPNEMVIYALGMEKAYGYFMGLDYSDDSEQIVQSQKMLEYATEQGIPISRAFCRKEINL